MLSVDLVSGVLRLVEFGLLFLSGVVVYCSYLGFFTHLAWQYPLAMAATSLLAVVLLDISDCYQVSALMRPISSFGRILRSEEHTSELQSLMRISYAVFCLHKKKT